MIKKETPQEIKHIHFIDIYADGSSGHGCLDSLDDLTKYMDKSISSKRSAETELLPEEKKLVEFQDVLWDLYNSTLEAYNNFEKALKKITPKGLHVTGSLEMTLKIEKEK